MRAASWIEESQDIGTKCRKKVYRSKEEFSDKEKRFLKQRPQLSWTELSSDSYTVSFSDSSEIYDSLFFEDRLSQEDKYQVFLDGNHPLVTVENRSAAAKGRLLVIRDSFANCLGCFWQARTRQ